MSIRSSKAHWGLLEFNSIGYVGLQLPFTLSWYAGGGQIYTDRFCEMRSTTTPAPCYDLTMINGSRGHQHVSFGRVNGGQILLCARFRNCLTPFIPAPLCIRSLLDPGRTLSRFHLYMAFNCEAFIARVYCADRVAQYSDACRLNERLTSDASPAPKEKQVW